MHDAIKAFFLVFSALFPIVDPLSASPIFLALTRSVLPATRQDSSWRVAGRTDRVSARKIGLALNGSTIGNSALNTRKKAFMASCIRQLEISLFNETARTAILWERGRKDWRLAESAAGVSDEAELLTESVNRANAVSKSWGACRALPSRRSAIPSSVCARLSSNSYSA